MNLRAEPVAANRAGSYDEGLGCPARAAAGNDGGCHNTEIETSKSDIPTAQLNCFGLPHVPGPDIGMSGLAGWAG
jgi:hypothetical protein